MLAQANGLGCAPKGQPMLAQANGLGCAPKGQPMLAQANGLGYQIQHRCSPVRAT